MRSTRLLPTGLILLFLLVSRSTMADGPSTSTTIDYNRDIRPILSESCYACHGPDPARRKADLRLDTREGLLGLKVGDGVVVPGRPDESELIARILSKDADEVMPPPKSGKSLSVAQAAMLKRWVESGADWKGHWAYIPPTRPSTPTVSGGVASLGAIDHFLQLKLVAKGLKPAAEADRITLIRRLSFDLLGLPPSTQEVDAFVKDQRPNAYELLVDRLMESPHFGERLAIQWLDLVRYADTIGYHSDTHRDVYLYRDYVIRSFNENKPFDRFTIEQLAGDLLANPTDESRIASGYNRMLMTTEEGGSQAKEYMAKYSADRVRNVSTVWMGATLGCAECHDHKFDPYTTKDFYSFAAFFADLKETPVGQQEKTAILRPEVKTRLAEADSAIAAVRKTLDSQTPELDRSLTAWETKLASGLKAVAWRAAKPTVATSRGGAKLAISEDGTILVSGASPERDTFTLNYSLEMANVTAIRLDALPEPSLAANGPGRAPNGNFVLNEFEIKTSRGPVKPINASASHSQENWAVTGAIDGNPQTGWAILPKVGQPNHAVFEIPAEASKTFGGEVTIRLVFDFGDSHVLGRFRISATDAPTPVKAEGQGGPPSNIKALLAIKSMDRSEPQRKELAAYYRSVAPELAAARDALKQATQRRDAIAAGAPTTLVSTSISPRMMRVLPRGNWLDDSGPVVNPSIPGFLNRDKPSDRRMSRLDLANWLVGPDNPLVARVFVNRLWQLAFGQGLVSSLDDFGSQGAWPTHPELLDWLAVDFRENGWNVKASLRKILMSRAYRASSIPSAEHRKFDPANVLFAHQNRFRLDAEFVRDNALAVSGLLVEKVGGPSAKPYQPAGYWAMLNFPKREWQSDHGEGLYRRGLYTYWCRTFPHPSMLAFDASSREECRVERARSNTPLQALVLLNDPSYVEAARAFAERVMREPRSDAPARLTMAYRLALSRAPRSKEVALLVALQQKHFAEYKADPKSTKALLEVGERPVPTDLDPAELASWTSVARVLLNLHETIERN